MELQNLLESRPRRIECACRQVDISGSHYQSSGQQVQWRFRAKELKLVTASLATPSFLAPRR
jgi:hypothetical protein